MSMREKLVVASVLFVVLSFSGPLFAAEFASAWPKGVERMWVGPEYYANRLIDWRVRDGRLECDWSQKNTPSSSGWSRA